MKKLALVLLASAPLLAQTPQIPTLQVCNGTTSVGGGTVQILARQDLQHTGKANIKIQMGCDPINGNGYPSGAFSMNVSFSDSSVATVSSTTVEQYTTTGKHTPTLYANGRCNASNPGAATIPCHWWLTIANNRGANQPNGTPDIVGFLIVDKTGKRLTYGTGPLVSGDINITPTSN
ncbi:MAG TPA: hypothetical protein VJ276_18455 [Thermoanaerobaculia bacterium]|nr:hypothetical protein [Thermoanaerobaculia bacterium]